MPVVDYAAREVHFRFIAVGPSGAGKATTLRRLHASLDPAHRGEFSMRPLGAGQLVRFDFTPPEIISTADHRARVEFLTLSGCVADPAHWSRLLAGTDLVLFVADSEPARMEENRALLREIAAQPPLADVPVVFLYNKRDASAATAVADMEFLLNPINAPAFQSTATNGDGLAPALAALCALALT